MNKKGISNFCTCCDLGIHEHQSTDARLQTPCGEDTCKLLSETSFMQINFVSETQISSFSKHILL